MSTTQAASAWLDRQPLARIAGGLYLLALGLALTAGYGFFYRSTIAALDFDEWEYWQLASGIMAATFDDPGRRTAGYPAILAGLRLIYDDMAVVQPLVSAIAASAPPLLAWLLLRMRVDRLPAVLAGVALACWPPHLFLSASLYSETVALPLLLLVLAALPRAADARSATIARWLMCGVLLGLLAHVRTMYQLFLPVVLLILLFDGTSWRHAIKGWALIVAGFLVAVLPWSIPVSARLGAPVMLTANGGETLAGGLNPKLLALENSAPIETERRTTWVGPGKWIAAPDTGYLSPDELRLPYKAQDRLLRERTVAWIIDNPVTAAHLTVRKLGYQWGVYPWARQSPTQLIFGNLPTLALLALTIFSLWRQRSARMLGARFYLMPLFVCGVAVISWGSWRFRHPADAAMLGIVAVATVAWLRQRRPITEASHA